MVAAAAVVVKRGIRFLSLAANPSRLSQPLCGPTGSTEKNKARQQSPLSTAITHPPAGSELSVTFSTASTPTSTFQHPDSSKMQTYTVNIYCQHLAAMLAAEGLISVKELQDLTTDFIYEHYFVYIHVCGGVSSLQSLPDDHIVRLLKGNAQKAKIKALCTHVLAHTHTFVRGGKNTS